MLAAGANSRVLARPTAAQQTIAALLQELKCRSARRSFVQGHVVGGQFQFRDHDVGEADDCSLEAGAVDLMPHRIGPLA
jgi:hypothetical protein